MTEALSALVAGLLGGVIQTTPYIGHPAYKKMGGRAAYTLATAVFLGAVGCLGGFRLLFAALPPAAMFPILVFIGLEITAQSFHATPARHYPALALAVMPALAALVLIVVNMSLGPREPVSRPDVLGLVQTLRCLAGGFIITSLLWAAALAMLIDGRLVRAATYFALAGVLALVGVIHSPLRDEQINLPHHILRQMEPAFREAVRFQTPYHWAGAYGLVVALLLALACFPAGDKPEAPPREKT
jgi:AGZA family xanthine/uracil permease-like MFS transporter